MAGTPTFLNFLRIWIGFVAFMAFGNTIQCFASKGYVYDRLYTIDTRSSSELAARLFGVWTLLSAGLRFCCAFNIENRVLYNLTLFSFLLALLHFISEVFIFKTAVLTAGIVAPLVVSSASTLLMLIGFFYLNQESKRRKPLDENSEILSGKARRKLK